MPLLVAICVYKSNNTYRIDEVSKIIINYLDDKSVVFKNYTLIDKDNIKTVINAMNNKEKLIGKIDIRTPDYSIIIFLLLFNMLLRLLFFTIHTPLYFLFIMDYSWYLKFNYGLFLL